MEFLRSFGSRTTPRESSPSADPSVSLEDREESRPNSGLSARTPIENLDLELEGSSQIETQSSVLNQSRRDFRQKSATLSRTTFVPVDKLPLDFDFGGSGGTNPIELQTDPAESQCFAVGNLSPPRHFQFDRGSGPVLGEFPIHQDAFAGASLSLSLSPFIRSARNGKRFVIFRIDKAERCR